MAGIPSKSSRAATPRSTSSMAMWSIRVATFDWSTRINRALPGPITRGRIALEIEAAELYFRNVELRNLD